MPTHVALLRGVNVGGAKRLAMADLRAVVEGLGFGDVRTLLASGNVVFSARAAADRKAGALIEAALAEHTGLKSRITVLSKAELAAVVAENPLERVADNPSRLMVAVPREIALLKQLASLAAQRWQPEVFAIGSRAAYLWLPEGIIDSPLAKALDRALRDAVTTRNWSTIQKLQAALAG